MYWALIKSIGSSLEESAIRIGIVCFTAFVIAALLSIFSYIGIDNHLANNSIENERYSFRWKSSVSAVLLGFLVFFTYCMKAATQIREEKKAIDQGYRAHLNYLNEKQKSVEFWVVIATVLLIVMAIIGLIFQESESGWIVLCGAITIGLAIVLMVTSGSSDKLEKEIAVTKRLLQYREDFEAQYDRTWVTDNDASETSTVSSPIALAKIEPKVIQQPNKQIAPIVTNDDKQRTLREVITYIRQNPESSQVNIERKFPRISDAIIEKSVEKAFLSFLNNNDFEPARQLLAYHPIDTQNLLSVVEKLFNNKKNGDLELKPQTFKILLANGETAYEKLPCNWQNIHTYMAPLQDEIEQTDILDTGNIYITDQRVLFVGKKGSESVYLSDIAYIDYKEDALQFFRDEGLSEIFAFPTADHAAYADLVIRHLLETAE